MTIDDRIAALVSGLFATTAILVMFYLSEIVVGYRILVYQPFGGIVKIPEPMGVIVFAVFGFFVWPSVFLYIGEKFAPKYETTRGIVLSLALWILFFLALVPAFSLIEMLVFGMISFLAHIVYGAILGFVFGALGGEHRNWYLWSDG